jgi:hypothetical protein
MLLETMNQKEITREIFYDYEWICLTSLVRIGDEYARERKKKRVPLTEAYTKIYEIKTKMKNRWMIFLSKGASDSKYEGNASLCFITFYYTVNGLRVFKIRPEGGLSVYNAHLFQRYNERMFLNLSEPLDRVKHFFTHNGHFFISVDQKNDSSTNSLDTLAVCKDGFLLGELLEDTGWVLHKTFISLEEAKAGQIDVKEELLLRFQEEIERVINEENFDVMRYQYLADSIAAIIKETKSA